MWKETGAPNVEDDRDDIGSAATESDSLPERQDRQRSWDFLARGREPVSGRLKSGNEALAATPHPAGVFGSLVGGIELTKVASMDILWISIEWRWSMVTKIQKWGNSQGLRLPKQVLEDARIAVGDDVDVTTRDGMIVIAPARRVRGKQSLKELVSSIPENYEPEEMDWGEPVGKEVW